MLSRAQHVRLFSIGTVAWAVFWVLGLPGYYQQYPAAWMAWFEVFLTPLLAIALWFSLLRRPAPLRLPTSLWMAFYFTVPLAIYDWLYCGVALGCGLRFLVGYWYLTTYYLLPWALLPALALLANRQPRLATAAQQRHQSDSRAVD
jgi:hypothetical protein